MPDWVSRELDVLVESHQGADALGRSFRDAPEIDGSVRIAGCARPPRRSRPRPRHRRPAV